MGHCSIHQLDFNGACPPCHEQNMQWLKERESERLSRPAVTPGLEAAIRPAPEEQK